MIQIELSRIRNAMIVAAVVLACSIEAGCSVPGMQMNAASDQPSTTQLSEADSQQISPDVYPINMRTIQWLDDQAKELAPRPLLFENKRSRTRYQYRIGPQDILRVTVWDHPELNNPGAITGSSGTAGTGISTTSTTILGTASNDSTSRVVNDDGTMFYPYVGLVQVEGKTVQEVQQFLSGQLVKTIRAPQVEVVVASYRSKRAYVTGEVKSPGVLPITDIPITVADALTASGGVNLDADLGGVTLVGPNRTEIIDVYALLYKGDLTQNVMIESGDVLNVPEQRYKKVFVLGEVAKASSLLLPRGRYSLNEALADAGGVSQLTAQASQIYVIRASASQTQIFHLDARTPDALVLGDSFNLRPRDIIFVDAAAVVRLGRVISQILPTLQALQAGKYLGQ